MKAQAKRRLTVNEQKALNAEVDRQLQRQAEIHGVNVDAMVLLTLSLHYGFEKENLRAFWEAFEQTEKELAKYYRETPLNIDGIREQEWYAVNELKHIGVDVELWRKLKKEWSPEKDEVWQKYG